MAKGRKKGVQTTPNQESPLLKLVKFNPNIIEDGNKTPNVQFDDYVGATANECGFELVKVKQTTVTEDNIKSTTNVYEDKYKIGNTFQEWIGMGWYPNSIESAVILYFELDFRDQVSKLKYCKDFRELVEIRKNFCDRVEKFMCNYAIPEVAKEVSSAIDKIKMVNNNVNLLEEKTKNATIECDELIEAVKGKYATMVDKGLLTPKQTVKRMRLEKD